MPVYRTRVSLYFLAKIREENIHVGAQILMQVDTLFRAYFAIMASKDSWKWVIKSRIWQPPSEAY